MINLKYYWRNFFMDLCPPPNIIIDQEALKYNGFTLERIAHGKSYEEFTEFFVQFLAAYFPNDEKPIIVGQYVTADLSFLASVFHHARRNSVYLKLGNDIIDTKSIANVRNAVARYHDQEIPHNQQASQSLVVLRSILEFLNIKRIQLVEIFLQHEKY